MNRRRAACLQQQEIEGVAASSATKICCRSRATDLDARFLCVCLLDSLLQLCWKAHERKRSWTNWWQAVFRQWRKILSSFKIFHRPAAKFSKRTLVGAAKHATRCRMRQPRGGSPGKAICINLRASPALQECSHHLRFWQAAKRFHSLPASATTNRSFPLLLTQVGIV